MDTTLISSPSRLSDRELIAQVKHLVCRERQATASLVAHLAELDERRLYRAEGCSSLFTYCVEVLHLSESAAYNRIEVARAVRKFPLILDKLSDGSVHLTTVRLLIEHLTDGNHRCLLDQAMHKSKRQVEELLACLRPMAAVPSSIRRLPARREDAINSARTPVAPIHDLLHPEPVSVSSSSEGPAPARVVGQGIEDLRISNSCSAAERSRAKVAPLAPDLYKIQITADAETYTRLCQAREMLRHQIPDGDAAAVIGLALKLLVDKLAAEKLGARNIRPARTRGGAARPDTASGTFGSPPPPVGHGRRSPKIPNCGVANTEVHVARPNVRNGGLASRHAMSRYIPVNVRHRVWSRDGARCAFVSCSGRRCTERGGLEFHHVRPFALGGSPDVDNIELRCRAHNLYEGELCFGAHISSLGKRARASTSSGTSTDSAATDDKFAAMIGRCAKSVAPTRPG